MRAANHATRSALNVCIVDGAEASTARRSPRPAHSGITRCAGRWLGLGFLHTASDASPTRLLAGLDRTCGDGRRGLAFAYRRPAVEKTLPEIVCRHLSPPSIESLAHHCTNPGSMGVHSHVPGPSAGIRSGRRKAGANSVTAIAWWMFRPAADCDGAQRRGVTLGARRPPESGLRPHLRVRGASCALARQP
jgi:hypothetical protein